MNLSVAARAEQEIKRKPRRLHSASATHPNHPCIGGCQPAFGLRSILHLSLSNLLLCVFSLLRSIQRCRSMPKHTTRLLRFPTTNDHELVSCTRQLYTVAKIACARRLTKRPVQLRFPHSPTENSSRSTSNDDAKFTYARKRTPKHHDFSHGSGAMTFRIEWTKQHS